MKQYLAIIKRDYAATGAETFWLPAPIMAVLVASLLTWLMASTFENLNAHYFLGLTLLCAYRILADLDLSQAHNLGFLAPNFKAYQFNYSTALVFISCLITCAVFSDSVYQFYVSAGLFWFLISLMFFFVKKVIWELAWAILWLIVLLVWFSMVYSGQPENIFSLLSAIYSSVWSVLAIPFIGITISSVCLALSFRGFLLAKARYLKPKEYNSGLAPRTWQQHNKTSDFNPLQLLANAFGSSKTWNKLESRILFGLDLGRHEDLLYLGLFGARTHRYLLKLLFGIVAIVLLVPLLFANDLNQQAILIPISMFMLFYLVVVCSVISLEWIANRHSISELWLRDASKTRARYMLKLAMLFAERIGRVSFLSSLAFLLLATLVSDMKGVVLVGSLALAGVILSLLLQTTYVLFVTLKVKNTGWLRYITILFTTINFAGWLSLLFFSASQKSYWVMALAIALAITLCFASIKYWCNYAMELAE